MSPAPDLVFGLKIMQWNANGLVAHKNELVNFLAPKNLTQTLINQNNSNKPHIICVQETFLKLNKTFCLDGYDVFRKDRLTNLKGGVATLVLTSLNAVLVDTPENIECIGVKIKLENSFINIFNIYQPPDIKIDFNIYKTFFETNNSILTGDFNAKNPLWKCPKTNYNGEILAKLLENYNFIAINTGQPTYQCPRGGQSTLDLTLTSSALALKCHWYTINNTLGSDHQPTFTELNINTEVEEVLPRWLLKKADWQKYTNKCKIVFKNWQQADSNPQTFFNNIVSSINEAAISNIPKSKGGKKTN